MRNTAVDTLDRNGVLISRAGNVALIKPADLPTNYDVAADEHTSIWEATHHLIRILEAQGIGPAGAFLAAATSRLDGAIDTNLVKELAFLMFSLAEKGKRTQDALYLQRSRHLLVRHHRRFPDNGQSLSRSPARLRGGLTPFDYSSSGSGGSVRSRSAVNRSSAEIGSRSSRTRVVIWATAGAAV